jgi:16S rRNA (cytosine1402-N4)-methyltransferase
VVNDYSRERSWLGCSSSTARSGSRAASPARIADQRSDRTPGSRPRHELADLCAAAVPAAARRKGHPAKRVFQALRIEVNDELGALRLGLERGIRALRPHGRMAVLSYHSLEDRIVKQAFHSGAHPVVPPALPIVPVELQPFLQLVTRGAEKPTDSEISANPRAASARLRVAAVTRPVPPRWEVAA